MSRGERVQRPTRKSEYKLVFASNSANRGWNALEAILPNQRADAWEFLASTPLMASPLSYPLKGELATVIQSGKQHVRWQRKLNLKDGARIWYFVIDKTVYVEQVHTSHPNQTK